jgi:hypothetical protein
VLLWKALGPHLEGHKVTAEIFRILGMERPPERGDYFVDLVPYLKEHHLAKDKTAEAMADELERCSQRAWTAREHPDVTAWLKVNEKPLTLVVAASKRPRLFAPQGLPRTAQGSHCMLLASIDYGAFEYRALARALTARAMLRVGARRPDDAWQDLLACHRLARLAAQGGTMIALLTGLAIEGIACTGDLGFVAGAGLSGRQLMSCLHDLQALPSMVPVADVVDLGARFELLDTMLFVARGGPPALESLTATRDSPPSKVPEAVWRPIWNRIDWDPALRSGNRWLDRLASAMRLVERAGREKQLAAWDADLKALRRTVIAGRDVTEALKEKSFDQALARGLGQTVGDAVVLLMVAGLRNVQAGADRTRQLEDNVQVAFGLAAYRRDRGGYPKALNALAPRYLAKVPEDRFSGKALVYRPSPDGYLLYSVGVNGKDEQGRGPEDEPPGDDLSVRMPPPKSR